MEEEKKKKVVHISVIICMAIMLVSVVGLIMLKYEVEGEKNMPFTLSKIMIVSTAEGMQNADEENKWNFQIMQNNDLYFIIQKNENYKKEAKIEKVILDNFQMIENPQVGSFKEYMPNSTEGRTFLNTEEFLIEDKLEYRGAGKTNLKNLEISNQGGTIQLRVANEHIGEYISNEEEQIIHDGTLIQKLDLTNEQLKGKISFDLTIKLEDKAFKANIILELPYGDILTEGTTSIEKTNMDDIIFKRV